MVNGGLVNCENSNILLFLNQNENSACTLSVFSYPLSLIHYPFFGAILNLLPSPPQPAGCVTATPLLLLLFDPDCIGIKIPTASEPNQKRRLMQLLVKMRTRGQRPKWMIVRLSLCWLIEWSMEAW
jgi:hypothetical protein